MELVAVLFILILIGFWWEHQQAKKAVAALRAGKKSDGTSAADHSRHSLSVVTSTQIREYDPSRQSVIEIPASRKIGSSRKGKRPYATVEKDGEHYAVTADEVAALFAPYRATLKDLQSIGRKAKKIAERYEATGKLDEVAYAPIKYADRDAERAANETMSLMDSIYFINESSTNQYFSLIDDFGYAEEDISGARDDSKRRENPTFQPLP